MTPLRLITVIACSACLAGCGNGEATLVETTGVVLLDGKPLEKIRVEFWPETKGPQSTGVTDAEGKFSLMTIDGQRKGAALGNHQVTLNDLSLTDGYVMKGLRASEDSDMSSGREPRIAAKYTNPTKSSLTAVVSKNKTPIQLIVDPYVPPPGSAAKKK